MSRIRCGDTVGGSETEVTDQQVVFLLGQEVRCGFFDLGIWKLFCDIFALSMQGEEVVKLPEGPYPGFPHMDGRIIEFSHECCQVLVLDILYGFKDTGSGKGLQLAQANLKGLDGAV
jgi:hypothetical protein